MSVTHDQIAKEVGVSRAIVTRTLHGTPGLRVSEETRLNIVRVAQELGYKPRQMTTHNIGMVTSLGMLQGQTDFDFANHVERALRERGYRLLLVNPEVPAGQSLSDVLNAKTVDGLLLSEWADGRYAALLSERMPCVLLTEEDNSPAEVEQVGSDLKGSLAAIFTFLYAQGHRRLALLSGLTSSSPFYRRVERAAQEAALLLGFEAGALRIMNCLPEEGHRAVLQLLNSLEPPTAVVAADEERAILVLNGLLGAGQRVPEDVSLVSLFDSRLLSMMTPTVTATSAGGKSLAERAVARLLEKIDMPETIPHHSFVSGEVIERQSVTKPVGD